MLLLLRLALRGGVVSSENKELVHRWVEEIFNHRDFGACERIVADTYIEHALAPFGQEAPGPVGGSDHMRSTVEWLISQYPDLHFEIEDLISEDDLVACRIRSQGTNTGPLNGGAASDRETLQRLSDSLVSGGERKTRGALGHT
jgi:hypothetical protein